MPEESHLCGDKPKVSDTELPLPTARSFVVIVLSRLLKQQQCATIVVDISIASGSICGLSRLAC